MTRRRTQFRQKPQRIVPTTSFMAVEGQNLRDLPQLLDSSQAQVIFNFNIDAQGQLEKRLGFREITEIGGKAKFFDFYYDDKFAVTYTDEGTSEKRLSVVDLVAITEEQVKTDFSEFPPISGDRYGNYFMLGTGGTEKIGRVSKRLDFDNVTVALTEGLKITGTTSGATAILLRIDGSALELGDIVGVFENNEQITDTGSGNVLADGTLYHSYEQTSQGGVAKIVKVLDAGAPLNARLFAGNLLQDETLVEGSNIDDGTNPPFDLWTRISSQAVDKGFQVFSRKTGEIQSISSLGQQVIAGGKFGRFGFSLSAQDVGGIALLDTLTNWNNFEEGMEFGSIETATGVYFAVNKGGLFRLLTGGQTNVPLSEQKENIGIRLGDDYFSDVDFTDLSIIEDTRRKLILFSFAKDSEVNNVVVAYNTDTKSIVTYGMNIQRFAKKNDVIYGTSSIDGKIYELFTGSSDAGNSIPVDYQQELRISSLDGLSDLENFLIQAILFEDSEYFIEFNIFDREGNQSTALTAKIVGKTPSELMEQWGTAGFGVAGFGTGQGVEDILSKIYQNSDIKIPEIWRLSIRIRSNDTNPAKINFFIADIKDREERINTNNIEILT